MEKLKPCPFCGGQASCGKNAFEKYQVICHRCLASSITDISEKSVIKAWNRRAEQ